ncbi:LytR/AlgR family response regulator transcription factor [Neptunicella sp. SCSIO 80796]|uniref:LytR/AlgR family response regulator transcription factor n=1 Tax=Neptunicella plasticusilytica TaxID=3117012 RepID=UPI003A4D7A93
MIKVMVVDDEALARQTILLLLKQQQDIDLILEASDGNQALEVFDHHHPDIVFLDIQMPGQTGIELAEKIADQCVIVFVTAYDQYAITAFEFNAIDYLLKPYDDQRFYTALEKARAKLHEVNTVNYHQVGEIVHHMMEEQGRRFKTRLVVKDPGRIRLVDVCDVDYIVGAGNYAEIHLREGKTILHRETLTTLENQLDPNEFIRIHRSSIVRRSFVTELRPNEKGDYTVILKNGEQLTLSRRNRHKLDELIG